MLVIRTKRIEPKALLTFNSTLFELFCLKTIAADLVVIFQGKASMTKLLKNEV